jgi:hypothetical protein
MEQSPPWEAVSRSDSQKNFLLLWKPKVQNHVHKNSLSGPILSSWTQSTYSHPIYLKIHFNIILSSTSVSPKWSFPDQNVIWTSYFPHACCVSSVDLIAPVACGILVNSIHYEDRHYIICSSSSVFIAIHLPQRSVSHALSMYFRSAAWCWPKWLKMPGGTSKKHC